MDFLTIGSLTIAIKWIILLVALLISYIILKMPKRSAEHSIILEEISNSLFIGFLVLKLSLIIVEPRLVMNNPLSLLYFTGGNIGIWLAVIIASTTFFRGTRKKELPFHDSYLLFRSYIVYSFSSYHLIFLVVNQDLKHLFYLLLPISVLIWWLIKNKRMQLLKNITILVGLVGLIGWAIYDYQAKTQSTLKTENGEIIQTGILKGEKAVDFSLKTVDGKDTKLSDYKGKKVILNFWATWCPPCKAEMPHMEEFYDENKDNNLVVLAVNLTTGEKNERDVEKFVKEYGLTFPVLMDNDGNVGNIYQAITIPTTYIIDTEGIIQQKIFGPMSKETMETVISKID